jgi:hypothetical protein
MLLTRTAIALLPPKTVETANAMSAKAAGFLFTEAPAPLQLVSPGLFAGLRIQERRGSLASESHVILLFQLSPHAT